jgi:hypothetical protein
VISVQTLMTPGGAVRSVVEMKSERKGLLRNASGESAGVTDQRGNHLLILVGFVLLAAAIYAFHVLPVSLSELTPVITGSPLLPLIVDIFAG